jgi:hypothetical protein
MSTSNSYTLTSTWRDSFASSIPFPFSLPSFSLCTPPSVYGAWNNTEGPPPLPDSPALHILVILLTLLTCSQRRVEQRRGEPPRLRPEVARRPAAIRPRARPDTLRRVTDVWQDGLDGRGPRRVELAAVLDHVRQVPVQRYRLRISRPDSRRQRVSVPMLCSAMVPLRVGDALTGCVLTCFYHIH